MRIVMRSWSLSRRELTLAFIVHVENGYSRAGENFECLTLLLCGNIMITIAMTDMKIAPVKSPDSRLLSLGVYSSAVPPYSNDERRSLPSSPLLPVPARRLFHGTVMKCTTVCLSCHCHRGLPFLRHSTAHQWRICSLPSRPLPCSAD